MEFYWEQIDENTHKLYGYEEEIAELKWNEEQEVWEIKSEWIKHSNDLLENQGKNDIKEARLEAIEQLIEASKEYMSWYQSQIDVLDELYQDMALS